MKAVSIWRTRKAGTNVPGSWRSLALFASIIGLGWGAIAGPLQLVSTLDPTQGPVAGGGGDSYAPIISADGRYVLFSSTANNLVLTSGTNPLPLLFPARMNVFLRDRTNDTTTLVSANLSGTGGGNGDSWPSALSTNARYGLFESTASDLVPGDTNAVSNVFIRDLVAGTTVLVNVSTNGGSANGVSRSSVMTPDGRYVAFVSEATNLVPGDTNRIPDVFVRDMQAGTTTLASAGAKSVTPPSNSGIWGSSSESPDITPDGHYVAFYSTASNLVAGVRTVGDIYVRDLVGGTTAWASAYARTAVRSIMGTSNAVCFNHALSDDGQFVAYEAKPFPVSSTAAAGLILRYSLQSGLTDLVHTNANAPGGTSYEDIHNLDLTPDGRFIAFIANTNGNSGATTCVDVWDAQTGTATLASGNVSNAVPAGSSCDSPALDTSGRFVAFLSTAPNIVTNLLAGDYHLYVRDLQAGATLLVDGGTNGVGSPMSVVTTPRLSADGRFVAFECPDAGLVPNDRNHDYDVFVREVATGAIELISARDPSLPSSSPNGSSSLSRLSVSASGRYIAFISDADNLVPNDTNSLSDIFVRDLLLGTNTLITAGTNGVAADGVCSDPAMSVDGRYAAFTSGADNLVAGDINKAQDVFVRDLQAGTTALVSVNTSGGQGNGNSYSPSISGGGRFALFHSLAQNLAAGSFTSGNENLFLRDMQLGTNYALTHTTFGTPVGAMTPDGRFVAFYGMPWAGSAAKLYVWDSLAASLVYTNAASSFLNLAVSADGIRIAYTTTSGLTIVDRMAGTSRTITGTVAASNPGLHLTPDGHWLTYALAQGTTNQVYVYDFVAGTNLLVSRGYSAGEPGNGSSDSPDISPDGRFIAYRSAASNLVPGDTNGVPDIYLYDRQNSTLTLLSASWLGPWVANNRSLTPLFSGDGQTLVFQSWASDVVAQDFNQASDIFAYSLYASGSIPLFSATVMPGTTPGRGPWITWPVLPGKTYSVQFKNSLLDAAWQPLGGGMTVVGTQAWLNDPSPGPGPRFYRVSAY